MSIHVYRVIIATPPALMTTSTRHTVVRTDRTQLNKGLVLPGINTALLIWTDQNTKFSHALSIAVQLDKLFCIRTQSLTTWLATREAGDGLQEGIIVRWFLVPLQGLTEK